jgi:hypothetical protein
MIPKSGYRFFGKDHAQAKINDGSDTAKLKQTLVRAPARGADQPGADYQCRRPVNDDRHDHLREAARGAGASAGTLRGKSCIRPQQASDG